jgi:hypothetical protein
MQIALDIKVMKLLLGHKNRQNFPEAYNILNLDSVVAKPRE